MGAFYSENPHFLKVKLPLQNNQRWLLLSWFSKFSGEDPQTPLSDKCLKLKSNNIQSTQHLVRSEVFKLQSGKQFAGEREEFY